MQEARLPQEVRPCLEFKQFYKSPKALGGELNPEKVISIDDDYFFDAKFDELRFDLSHGSVISLFDVGAQEELLSLDPSTDTFSLVFKKRKSNKISSTTAMIMRLLILALAKYETVGVSYGYDTTAILWPLHLSHPKNTDRAVKEGRPKPSGVRQIRTLISFADSDDPSEAQKSPYVIVCVLKAASSATKPIFSDPSTDLGFEDLLAELHQQPPNSEIDLVYDLVVITYQDPNKVKESTFLQKVPDRIGRHVKQVFRLNEHEQLTGLTVQAKISSQSVWSGMYKSWLWARTESVAEGFKKRVGMGKDESKVKIGGQTVPFFPWYSQTRASAWETDSPIFGLTGAADNICLQGRASPVIRGRFLDPENKLDENGKRVRATFEDSTPMNARLEDARDRLFLLASGADYKIFPPDSDLLPPTRTIWAKPKECPDPKYDAHRAVVLKTRSGRIDCLPATDNSWRCIHPSSHGALHRYKNLKKEIQLYCLVDDIYVSVAESRKKIVQISIRNRYASLVLMYIRSSWNTLMKNKVFEGKDKTNVMIFLWVACLTLEGAFLQAFPPEKWYETLKEDHYDPEITASIKAIGSLEYQNWFYDKSFDKNLGPGGLEGTQEFMKWHHGLINDD